MVTWEITLPQSTIEVLNDLEAQLGNQASYVENDLKHRVPRIVS